MSRFFKKFPKTLEQYNPELLNLDSASETFDKEGHLHSFDDIPALTIDRSLGKKQAYWYSHGQPYRANDKPVSIYCDDNYYYRTNNDQKLMQTYGDKPSYIEFSNNRLLLTWTDKGTLHRTGDLPAEVIWRTFDSTEFFYLSDENYIENGEKHRGGNLPASSTDTSQDWYVRDVAHNTQDASHTLVNDDKSVTQLWTLYGVGVSKKVFDAFKQVEQDNNVPSWVAFLVFFEVLQQKDLEALCDNTGSWDSNLPLPWVLRSLGLTNDIFLKKFDKFRKKHHVHLSYIRESLTEKFLLEGFIDVATFEVEENLLQLEGTLNV